MVSPASQVNRPFFECPQARCGLACIENGGLRMSDCGAKFRGERGDAFGLRFRVTRGDELLADGEANLA